jgi:glyoxylase-like metal-dependent hydrolase (beta-lactamase superfamily II)
LNGSFYPVTEAVFQVGGSALTSPEDAAIYLIKHEGYGALVDAGCGQGTGRLFKNVSACSVEPQNIEYLLITHCHYDHTGGARQVRDRTGCRIVAHELDARFLEEGDEPKRLPGVTQIPSVP